MKITIGLVGVVLLAWVVPVGAADVPTAAYITRALNLSAQKGVSPTALYNMGQIIFSQYPPSRDLAQNLAEGFDMAKGTTPEQDEALKKASRYWRAQFESWNEKYTTSGETDNYRPFPYWLFRGEWESTLKMEKPSGR